MVNATIKGNIVGKQLLNSKRNQIRKIKTVMVTSDATADDGEILSVTLANYGLSATGLLAVRGVTHSTVNSIIVIEAPTTTVTDGVLAITIGGSTDNKVRYFLLIGEEL